MNPRTRQKEILQYIKENPNCTKTEVTVEMEKKGIASPAVSHKIIERLQSEGKIIVNIDNSNHRIHHLTINDRNEFHLIIAKINEIKKRAEELNKIISYRLKLKKLKRTEIFDSVSEEYFELAHIAQMTIYDSVSEEYFDLIHLAQLTAYMDITSTANRIRKNIKSRDDQETLYLRLALTLNASNKLNEMLTPEIYTQVQKFANKINDKRDPTKALVISNLIKEVSDLFVKR